jgi:hypothetical protein
MDYPVTLEGFEGHEIKLRVDTWSAAPILLLDGEVAPPGPKRNQYLLTRDDGTEELVKFRNSLFDPVPQLKVGNQTYNVAEPLAWHELIWCLLPLGLVFFPGIDGILLAFAGCWVNNRLFRSERPLTQRYALTAAVTLAAVGIYMLFTGRLRLSL